MSAKRATILLFLPLLIFLTVYCSKSESPAPAKSETKVVQQKKIESDMELRKQFASEIEEHLNKEEFDQLETIADKLTKGKDRFPGGDWKLDRFYEVISPPADNGIKVNWTERFAKTKKWIAQKPDSIYANIALGSAQSGKAWELRGPGFINTVSKKQMDDSQDMLKQAETTLKKMSEKRKSCLHWYREMQGVGLGLSYDLETMSKYLEEAIAAEPLYWSVYEGHALYLLPRWYGNEGDWVNFTKKAADQIGGTEGDILYSEICWRMSRYYPANEFFKENNTVSYDRVKKGFKLRSQQYGMSVRYLNAFCLLAGGIGDKTTTKALMNKIGDQWEPDFWKEKKYFDDYKKWASE